MESSRNTITPQAVEPAPSAIPILDPPGDPAEESGPCLSIAKAHGPFRDVVRWLENRTFEEKAATVVAQALLAQEDSLKDRGLYATGDAGNELEAGWRTEILDVLTDNKKFDQLDQETQKALSFMGALICAD